jgi:hypothetical protein
VVPFEGVECQLNTNCAISISHALRLSFMETGVVTHLCSTGIMRKGQEQRVKQTRDESTDKENQAEKFLLRMPHGGERPERKKG